MSSSSSSSSTNNNNNNNNNTSNLNLPSIILPQINHYQSDQTITFNQSKLNSQPQINQHLNHLNHHHLQSDQLELDLDLDSEELTPSEIVQDHDDDEDEDDDAQYAMPMDDPYAEVEHGWRRMSETAVSSSQKNPKHQIKPINTWSNLSNPNNEEVVNQLSGFSFSTSQSSKPNKSLNQSSLQSRKFSLPAPILSNHPNPSSGVFNLSMRRSDQPPNSFKPPGSASSNKTSFSNNELIINPPHRSRLPSFSTELEPISGSPTSPDSPMIVNSSDSTTSTFSTCTTNTPPHSIKSIRNQSLPPSQSAFHPPPSSSSSLSGLHQSSRTSTSWKSNSQDQSYSAFDPTSSSSSSLCSSSDEGLLRRASCSSLASVASLTSSQNGSTSGLKARRGLTKPLSLAMPSSNLSTTAPTPLTGLNTRSHLHPSSNDKSNAFRSLPPSPRLTTSDHLNMRDQIVGMRANVTGSLSMKRRTSIPRLSLGGISHATPTLDPNRRSSLAVTSSNDYVKLLGRNLERSSNSSSVASTPLRLHFDPMAARDGKTELMSSQVGVGGRGHIERPQAGINGEPVEEYPYQNGPREVLPGIYLGSEQNARDVSLLNEMGFSCIINVAKEVECPWSLPTYPSPSLTPMTMNPGEMMSVETTAHQDLTPIVLATPHPPQRLQVPNQISNQSNSRTFLVRPTASTPNLHRSYQRSPESNPLLKSGSISTHHKKASVKDLPMNANGEIECEFPSDQSTGRPCLEYHKLPWSHDQDGLAIGGKFDEVFGKIDVAIQNGKKILVHCQCGVSRSATLVIGYCMRESVLKRTSLGLGDHSSQNGTNGNGGMHEAYTFVKEKSPWAGPNMGLIYQLIEYEKVLKKKILMNNHLSNCKSSVGNGNGNGKMMIMNEQEEEEEEEEEEELDGARTPTGGLDV
ncbi:uncharacterized protein MELLADRAFT_63838 [Melampsora larici-populina 98AG31]|uniref:protein-tyrosine-phosphatase n=1 Tax=Melampsora larici-populina (strain 98AG31 / pathotype 3-4-7) TaxID=747676 RepID=F4RPB8_MELLP|nr:uncharacterized protein MELLADRAFT_63838 [Melampsora larici-populina 98AG31]EGG05788.1 hypothetical protein MELLADRAFT_63838 [Melampsora larici-populina 98AG31]